MHRRSHAGENNKCRNLDFFSSLEAEKLPLMSHKKAPISKKTAGMKSASESTESKCIAWSINREKERNDGSM
jgi:hypothetical protein